jgi:hypothetical protein
MRFSTAVLALLPLSGVSHALCTDRHQHQLLEQPPLDLPLPKITAEDIPDWRRLSNLDVVPLHPKARTGLIPPAVEEGLIFACKRYFTSITLLLLQFSFYSLQLISSSKKIKESLSLLNISHLVGPRFANVFIEDAAKDRSHTTDIFCFLKCASNLIKLAPCIVVAVTTRNPVALLSCGLDKGTVSLSIFLVYTFRAWRTTLSTVPCRKQLFLPTPPLLGRGGGNKTADISPSAFQTHRSAAALTAFLTPLRTSSAASVAALPALAILQSTLRSLTTSTLSTIHAMTITSRAGGYVLPFSL